MHKNWLKTAKINARAVSFNWKMNVLNTIYTSKLKFDFYKTIKLKGTT